MNLGLGPHRLLRDRGARLALVALAGILAIAALDFARTSDFRLKVDDRPTLAVRATCQDRAALGAVFTLLAPLTEPPAKAGRRVDRQVAPITGRVDLRLPFPTPPGFKAHLMVAAPGCFSQRLAVDAAPRPHRITLAAPQAMAGPWDLADPPDSPVFPTPAQPEHLARLRALGTFSASTLYLVDGPPVSCGQCHVSTGAEHARGHGSPPTATYAALAAAAGPARAATCAACHAPTLALASQDGLAAPQAGAAFSCSSCHRVDPARLPQGRGLGPFAVVLGAPGDRRALATGTRGDTASPVMAVVHTPALAAENLCLACHAGQRGSLVLDPTGEEHAAWKRVDATRAATTCQTCHMPPGTDAALVDGAAYQMWGQERPDDPRRLHALAGTAEERAAKAVTLETRWQGNTLVVTLNNQGASHALPGAWPRAGWELSVEGAPALQDGPVTLDGRPGVVLRRALANGADGCAPPWDATQLGQDTRLVAGTPLSWSWRFERAAAVTVVLRRVEVCGDAPATSQDVMLKRVVDVERPARVDD